MAEKFQLRLANIDDMKNVFDLSNDDLVRQNSIHSEKIEWENHVEIDDAPAWIVKWRVMKARIGHAQFFEGLRDVHEIRAIERRREIAAVQRLDFADDLVEIQCEFGKMQ